MTRTEYYDTPDAPEPNSLVVATSAVIEDSHGRILLQRRTDSGNWALPGGAMEMHESLTDSVIRETKEETGLEIEVTGLVGTYTDPKHIIAYTDGEVRRQFNICYTARVVRGELQASSESTALAFVHPSELDSLPIHHTQRLRLTHFLQGHEAPHLG
jgi:ADP-ribose pyrophosphatase YjhB (NUDIX family)